MASERYLPLDIVDTSGGLVIAREEEVIAYGTSTVLTAIDPRGYYLKIAQINETEPVTVHGRTVGGVDIHTSFFGSHKVRDHLGLYESSRLTQLVAPEIPLGQLFLVLAKGHL